MNTVRPSVFCRVPISSSNSAAPIGSRPEVGSSRNRSSGSSASARASAARLIMPPDRSEGRLWAASGGNPTSPILSMASSSASSRDRARCSRMGIWMFCLTVSPESRAPCWNITPKRRCSALNPFGVRASRSCPKTAMLPARLGTRPRIVRVRTDLPMPEPPTKPSTSPCTTSRSRSCMMILSPKPTVSPRTAIASGGRAASAATGGERAGGDRVGSRSAVSRTTAPRS